MAGEDAHDSTSSPEPVPSYREALTGDIKGVTVNLKGDNIMLFDRIRVMITEVNIAQAVVMAELVNKLEKDEMEL